MFGTNHAANLCRISMLEVHAVPPQLNAIDLNWFYDGFKGKELIFKPVRTNVICIFSRFDDHHYTCAALSIVQENIKDEELS